ncbi:MULTISPECIES: hypothetical protein [unclassified Sphingomonas]|uniref:hypothetical protein n=1 Tax=unclassified Sphingomonas TaxID=196159 RepID=UPI00226A03CD|nr:MULTISPECIES: hypothetical protein [unclassified Sphingomonas]
MNYNQYTEAVKHFPLIIAAGLTTMLVGCSVGINPTQVVARAASPEEIHNDPEASSARPDAAGAWVMLQALISREDAERIARWEVYPHVYIVECATGRETNVGTEPRLNGIQIADANAMRAALRSHPVKRTYQMRSLVFAREMDFQTPQCLKFRGGSYTGQKMVETPVPIRSIGRFPSGRFPPGRAVRDRQSGPQKRPG